MFILQFLTGGGHVPLEGGRGDQYVFAAQQPRVEVSKNAGLYLVEWCGA